MNLSYPNSEKLALDCINTSYSETTRRSVCCRPTTIFDNFRRLVLGCIEADFCEQWRIFSHFSRSTRFTHFCAAPNLIFAKFCKISVIFQDFEQIFVKFAETPFKLQTRLKLHIFGRKFHGILSEFQEIVDNSPKSM